MDGQGENARQAAVLTGKGWESIPPELRSHTSFFLHDSFRATSLSFRSRSDSIRTHSPVTRQLFSHTGGTP